MTNFPNFIARNICLTQYDLSFKLAYVAALAKLITIAGKGIKIPRGVAKIHTDRLAFVFLFWYDFLAAAVQTIDFNDIQWFSMVFNDSQCTGARKSEKENIPAEYFCRNFHWCQGLCQYFQNQ